VLQPIKVLEGSFGGAVLYENCDYVCPNTARRQRRLATANKYVGRVEARQHLTRRRQEEPETQPDQDPVFEAVFGATGTTTTDLKGLRRKIDQKSTKKKTKKRRKIANDADWVVVLFPLQSKSNHVMKHCRSWNGVFSFTFYNFNTLTLPHLWHDPIILWELLEI